MTALRRTAPALLLLAGAVLGCKPEPLTLVTAKPLEETKPTTLELKPPAKPEKSDPEARKKLDAVLAAHTGGKVELLQKLKGASFVRTGLINVDGPPGRTSVQTIDVDWPARYKYRTEIQFDGLAVFQAGLTPAENWRFPAEPDPSKPPPAKPEKQKLDADVTLTVRRQMQEDALFLLFPFADPATVVLPAADAVIADKECFGLHVWTPALEYALVHVEKANSMLVRYAFKGRERRVEVVKELVFEEFADYGGVKLGSKIYLKAASTDLASWRSLTVTAGKTFDAKYFDNP